MSEMIIIRPVPFAEDQLVSSNAEETVPLFDDSEPYVFYSLGQRVRSSVNGRIYENLVPLGTSFLTTITPETNPVEFNRVAHGLSDGDIVTFKEGTGPLINEVEQGVPYRVRPIDADKFNLYASLSNPDPDDLIEAAGGQTTWFYFFYKGDPNTGYWSDPGLELDYEALNPNVPVTVPRWLDIGPNNTMAMFELLSGVATTRADSLQVTHAPGARGDALGLEGLRGESVRVQVSDGETDQYDETIPLVNHDVVVDWHSFFFGERTQRAAMVLDDLPIWVTQPEITLTVSAEGGEAAIAAYSFGRSFEVGGAQYGMRLGIRDFTLKERGAFGEWKVVQRPYSKTADVTGWLPNGRIDGVSDVLAALRAEPIFWRLVSRFNAATILGFYRGFHIEIEYSQWSIVSYEIEGVT